MIFLQKYVDYFNDRLEQEFETGFRPFMLTADEVYGLFGPIRIGSHLEPIRKTLDCTQVIAHLAKQCISPLKPQRTLIQEPDNSEVLHAQPRPSYESIINLDRLTRAVHLLNYLPHADPDKPLILDVDPRHILAIKEDHGAYFEEMIIKCGLKTSNIAISLLIDDVYVRFYSALLKGLDNYQRRGYRVALQFDYPVLENTALELLSRVAPDYVALSADYLEQIHEKGMLAQLNQFTDLVASMHS
jgi:hypothetical protein